MNWLRGAGPKHNATVVQPTLMSLQWEGNETEIRRREVGSQHRARPRRGQGPAQMPDWKGARRAMGGPTLETDRTFGVFDKRSSDSLSTYLKVRYPPKRTTQPLRLDPIFGGRVRRARGPIRGPIGSVRGGVLRDPIGVRGAASPLGIPSRIGVYRCEAVQVGARRGILACLQATVPKPLAGCSTHPGEHQPTVASHSMAVETPIPGTETPARGIHVD